jgi:hypothetical protein
MSTIKLMCINTTLLSFKEWVYFLDILYMQLHDIGILCRPTVWGPKPTALPVKLLYFHKKGFSNSNIKQTRGNLKISITLCVHVMHSRGYEFNSALLWLTYPFLLFISLLQWASSTEYVGHVERRISEYCEWDCYRSLQNETTTPWCTISMV